MVQWNEMQISSKKNRKDQEELHRELASFVDLSHDNIAKMFDFWIDSPNKQKRVVYITELMTSGTLQQYLQKNDRNLKPLQQKVWQRWCLQMLSALKCVIFFACATILSGRYGPLFLHSLRRYLHDCKLCHGDLSAKTIHIQHNGQIKLGIFNSSAPLSPYQTPPSLHIVFILPDQQWYLFPALSCICSLACIFKHSYIYLYSSFLHVSLIILAFIFNYSYTHL